MSEQAPAPRMRASDADRDRILDLLQQAHGDGRLTVSEFGERQDEALRAKFLDELQPLVADLPGSELAVPPQSQPAVVRPPQVPATVEPTWRFPIMSGRDVSPLPGTTIQRSFAWWGGDNIDLTDAMGPGVVFTLELHAVMAGNDVLVPLGVRVVDESIAIMAGNSVDPAAQGDGSNGTLILKGFLFWAGNDVKISPRAVR